jgi:hypothetical protein
VNITDYKVDVSTINKRITKELSIQKKHFSKENSMLTELKKVNRRKKMKLARQHSSVPKIE